MDWAPKREVVSAKQGKCQQGPETDHSARGLQAGSWVFRQDSKNECQDTVEKKMAISLQATWDEQP
jgi:hypothetical protein